MFEGVPTYPDAGRFWEVCAKHKVTQFYTAPTAIRSADGTGARVGREARSVVIASSWGRSASRSTPKHGTGTTPMSQGALPDCRYLLADETGGHIITPLPGAIPKARVGHQALLRVKPVVHDPATAKVQEATETEGVLCIADSWPGQMRTLWGDHARFEEAYFSQYPGYYFTGDGCRRDADGYYWITGRVDDVITSAATAWARPKSSLPLWHTRR